MIPPTRTLIESFLVMPLKLSIGDRVNFKKTMLASLLMVSASGAFAGNSATLKVTGSIAPTACSVDFGGGGDGSLEFNVVDYVGLEKTLEPQSIDFTISCDPGASKVTFQAINNGSQTPGNGPGFGLGMISGTSKAIGYYKMVPKTPLADGEEAQTLVSLNGGAWQPMRTYVLSPPSGNKYAFGSLAATPEPVAAKVFSSTLEVTPVIAAGLPVDNLIELNGSATFEITQI